jgi:hypothetical protein
VRARDVSAPPQAIIVPLMQRWTHFAQYAVSVAYDLALIESNGGDMSISMLRTFSCVFASVGPQVFAPFLESVVHPAVLRIAAAVVTDGESEYQDGIWDGFASNFVQFLENILLYPSQHCTDILVRHDVLSCIMRLLAVSHSSTSLHLIIRFI